MVDKYYYILHKSAFKKYSLDRWKEVTRCSLQLID